MVVAVVNERAPGDAHALHELEGLLVALRWCAVAGQAISVWLAHGLLDLRLSWGLLALGIGVLALGNGLLWWLRRPGSTSERRVLIGLGLDLAALTWALYFSGGVMNPFTMLYLLPVALTATVLAPSRVVLVALAGVAGYGLLALAAPPLPHLHGQGALDLHLAGMGVNFMLSLVLLCAFGLRLAATQRAQQAALRAARERQLRDEALHTLALQAASAAHAINTPLATMGVVIDEMRVDGPASASWDVDLRLLAQQVEQSQQALRQLIATAADRSTVAGNVGQLLQLLCERSALLRPACAIEQQVPADLVDRPIRWDATLLATLGTLLDNAADAGLARGDPVVGLEASAGSEALLLCVRDGGAGIDAGRLAPGRSHKPGGLGWGLTIANATIEQLGGRLQQMRADGITETRIELPWSALAPGAVASPLTPQAAGP
ncbi:MAG: hypothetical protein R3F15_19090 [Lysobacterales bacterium]